MDALLTLVWMLVLLTVSGLGPTLLLLPRRDSATRIILAPAAGMCCIVLLSMSLVRFHLTGSAIAKIDLGVLAAIAVIGIVISPPRLAEWKRALWPGLIAAGALALIAWPLFYQGSRVFIGFANPDEPALLQQMIYLASHSFGLAGGQAFSGYAYGVRPDLVLGLSYVAFMAHVTAGAPIWALFSVCGAAMVALAPLSVYVLCEEGLRTSRSIAIIAAVVTASSAQLADTFFSDSLGTLSVMAIGPAIIAVALLLVQEFQWKTSILLVLLWCGMLYNYYPGTALLAVLVAAIVLAAILERKITLRAAVLITGMAGILLLAVSLGYAGNVIRNLAHETSGSMILQKRSEIELSFDLALTERIVPYIWGLRTLAGGPDFLGPFTLPLGIAFGGILSVLAALSIYWGAWSSRLRFGALLAAYGVACGFYQFRQVGYGVFKLVAWGQPILIVAAVGCCWGLAVQLKRRSLRAWYVPVAGLAALLLWNAYVTLWLGRACVTGNVFAGVPDNLPGATLANFQALEAPANHLGGIVSVIGDPVANRWISLFLGPPQLKLLPAGAEDLDVVDSTPVTPDLAKSLIPDPSSAMLYRVDRAPGQESPVIWKGTVYGLTPASVFRDQLVYGLGWYREESVTGATVEWQHDFRWLRKRGEIFLLNPTERQYRLGVTTVAGYGFPSHNRTINFYVNGVKFDQRAMAGYARIITKPFTATTGITQLEIEVSEDVQPIQRDLALWNAWVPKDARHLNIAVAQVHLIGSQDHVDASESVNLLNPESFAAGEINGIYPDRWMGREVNLELTMPPGATDIEIDGTLPRVAALPLPYHVTLKAEGRDLGDMRLNQSGHFQQRIGISEDLRKSLGGSSVRLTLVAESTFRESADRDARTLAIRLDRIGFLAPKANSSATAKLVREGAGEHP